MSTLAIKALPPKPSFVQIFEVYAYEMERTLNVYQVIKIPLRIQV